MTLEIFKLKEGKYDVKDFDIKILVQCSGLLY